MLVFVHSDAAAVPLGAPLHTGETVQGNIDWARRFDHMQQHTGEHILSGIAHEQFGWVPEGEQTANVHGLAADAGNDEGSNFTANIVVGSVEAPETWYSPVLDALFGVK